MQAVPTAKGQALADEFGIQFFETVSSSYLPMNLVAWINMDISRSDRSASFAEARAFCPVREVLSLQDGESCLFCSHPSACLPHGQIA